MRRKVELPLSGAACNNKATPSAASEQGKSCRPLLRSGQGFDACSSFSHKSVALQNLCGSPKIIPQNSLTRLLREPYDSFRPFRAPSRAVESALGQETARSMCHFQVRRRQRAHRALRKNAPAHPQRGRQGNSCFLNYFREQNHALALLKYNPARRVPLRCGTQFASYQRLIVK